MENNDKIKIAMVPAEGLVEIRKYSFDVEQNETFALNQDGSFVRASEEEVENRMCKK